MKLPFFPRKEKPEISAQETIPIERIYPDGTVKSKGTGEKAVYSRSVRFHDRNYALEGEGKKTILEAWGRIFNLFDQTVHLQLTYITDNGKTDGTTVWGLADTGDGFDAHRCEYTGIVKKQISSGRGRYYRDYLLTFSVKGVSYVSVKEKLERVGQMVLSGFKRLGVFVEQLDGKKQVALLYGIFHIGMPRMTIRETDKRITNILAPSSFEFPNARSFRMGDRTGSVGFLQILTPELDDEVLMRFLNLNLSQIVNFHIEPVDQISAIKMIRHKLTDLNKSKIDEQQKAVRAGYDMDVLPSELKSSGEKIEQLLESLSGRSERYFQVTILLCQFEKTAAKLKEAVSAVSSAAQECNCNLVCLDFQQEDGLISCLPIGVNRIEVQHGLTTSALAVFSPFVTRDLPNNGKESLYCGMNRLSEKPIFTDRKILKNPNGLILGTPGSGKSFAAKREILNVFLATGDDIIICDPESEYGALTQHLHGQVIRISPTSQDYLNPMDIDLEADDDPLRMKADFLLSLCGLLVGGREGLKPLEISIIDRCVPVVYAEYLADPVPQKMPVLENLYQILKEQPERAAKDLAAKLEIYVHGSMNVFNHRSNISVDNRIVCFDCKDLGNQLKSAGMLMIQDTVWNRVAQNREKKRSTRYYIDEMHLLLHDAQTAAYMMTIWKRFRKWGGIPTGITQNVKDFLASPEIKNIFENSDYVLMLNQAKDDQRILAEHLGMNEDQLACVTRSEAGEGLMFYGNTVVPFRDKFPTNTEMYRIMSTKFNE